MGLSLANESLLGSYLKDRRTRLDPSAFGLSGTRRRTPGLRRGLWGASTRMIFCDPRARAAQYDWEGVQDIALIESRDAPSRIIAIAN